MNANWTDLVTTEEYDTVKAIVDKLRSRYIPDGHGDKKPRFPGGLHRQFLGALAALEAHL